MRLEYELNPTDLKEFQAAHFAAVSKVPRRTLFPLWIAILVAAYAYGKLLARYHDFDAARLWLRVALILLPMSISLAAAIVLAWVQARGPLRYPWRTALRALPRSTARRTWLLWLILFALIAYCFGMLYAMASLERGEPDAAREIAYDVGFMLVLIAMFVSNTFLLILNKARQRVTSWPEQRPLHGPQVAEIDESGITITNARSRLEYRWAAFAGFRETANLVILYLTPVVCQILPKRALPDPREADALRALLSGKIQEGHLLPRPSGFPVGHSPVPALSVDKGIVA